LFVLSLFSAPPSRQQRERSRGKGKENRSAETICEAIDEEEALPVKLFSFSSFFFLASHR